MKILILCIAMLFQSIHIYGQEATYQTKANHLLQKAIDENQCAGIAGGF
ncbi:MAG: hypothetical protein IPL46_15285 [Saprospiraceae bacterium]|nr:hypothetical protein [Saprospiraceae bacterium]